MPSPATKEEFLDVVSKAEVVEKPRLNACLERVSATSPPETANQLADILIQEGLLTNFQAVLLLKGQWDRFRIGPYRILDRLGSGEMSNVYLCQHRATRARVAVKVLTEFQAKDPKALKRFFREARAAAPLDHLNIVRVRDIDWDNDRHYIVMDYIDGSSIQEIVKKFGSMDIHRTAHYLRQAADGLQYAHDHGLVHRDIKPGNLLLDRQGRVRILDMGIARMVEENMERLTQGEVLGAPEFLSPEQAVDSHEVDIRTDIYSLGATGYFMITGEAPYSEEKSPAAKLLVKHKRPPKPIRSLRSDIPEELAVVVETMMAKEPDQRYQTPRDVVKALKPWTQTPIEPPPPQEMPKQILVAPRDEAPPDADVPAASPPAADQQNNWGVVQVVVFLILGIITFAIAWAFLSYYR